MAWVDQAKSLLEVSEISLEEYRKGIYPQDVQLVRQYALLCRTEADRTTRNYIWSKETAAKGYRSQAQLKADELSMQQAQIALQEADGMVVRLETFTGPKLSKSLEAKSAAIEAQTTKVLGEAKAKSVKLAKEAKAERFQLLVKAMGGADSYGRYVFAEGLPENLHLGIFYAGPGTLWTDLKGFEQTMLGKLASESQARDAPTPARADDRAVQARREP